MNPNEYIPLHTFARREGLRYRNAYLWCWQGLVIDLGFAKGRLKLPYRKVGKRIDVRVSDANRFLAITGLSTPSRDTLAVIAAMSGL